MSDIVIGSPYLVQFNLLTKCIFDCDYCYLADLRKRRDEYLSFPNFKRFVDKFSKYYFKYDLCLKLNLTGGDLWFHPDVEKILNYVSSLPYVVKIGLMLNNLWHPDSRHLIGMIRNKISSIQLNIDSLTDREGGLLWLAEQNIRVSVKVMISKDKSYFDAQLKILDGLREKVPDLRVAVDRLCPVLPEQIGNVASREDVMDMVGELRKRGQQLYIEDDPYILANLKKDNLINAEDSENEECLHGCAIPRGGLTVYPDGSIKLCARIPQYDTGYTIDNFDLVKYIERFSSIKLRDQICDQCALVGLCQGGCPATSYVYNHEIISKDINCLSK